MMSKKYRTSSISIEVDVDLSDIADQIPDEDILEWAADIRKRAATDGGGKQAAVKAITEIRAGRLADAITTLEHEFLPKWADRDACQAAYRKAVEPT